MYKKTFILTQFGTPHEWAQEYIQDLGKLESTGWYWKIFTPHKYENVPNNVEIIPMTIEEMNALMKEKIGVDPQNYILPTGFPSKHVSDFYVASGKIFEDYLVGSDFWGITNWDVVYGRLSYYVPDQVLEQSDIFSDDVGVINGVFTLFRNREDVNTLFKEIPEWEYLFSTHQLYGTDEYHMTDVVNQNRHKFSFVYPSYYPMLSHDRLEQHVPEIKLTRKEDGSLWELFSDTNSPSWLYERPVLGREIPLFHFIRTKKWPKII